MTHIAIEASGDQRQHVSNITIHTYKKVCAEGRKNPGGEKELRTNTYKKKARIGGEILGSYDFFAIYPSNIMRSPAAVGFLTP